MIKQWFMWVKPNFEKVSRYLQAVSEILLTCDGSMSIHSGRMEVSIYLGSTRSLD